MRFLVALVVLVAYAAATKDIEWKASYGKYPVETLLPLRYGYHPVGTVLPPVHPLQPGYPAYPGYPGFPTYPGMPYGGSAVVRTYDPEYYYKKHGSYPHN